MNRLSKRNMDESRPREIFSTTKSFVCSAFAREGIINLFYLGELYKKYELAKRKADCEPAKTASELPETETQNSVDEEVVEASPTKKNPRSNEGHVKVSTPHSPEDREASEASPPTSLEKTDSVTACPYIVQRSRNRFVADLLASIPCSLNILVFPFA